MTDKPWEIAFQQHIITKKMKETLDNFLNYFHFRTQDGHVIIYGNGFVAVGILKKPHVSGKDNIWIYEAGPNLKGTRIVELTNVEMTVGEAEDRLKCLEIGIKKAKEGGER